MPFVSQHENPLPQFVELKTEVVLKEGQNAQYQVLVELRIHPSEIDESVGQLSVSIKKAWLSVDFLGVSVVPKTKYGNPVRDVIVDQEKQCEVNISTFEDTKRAEAIRGKGGVSVVGPKAEAELKNEKAQKSGEKKTVKESWVERTESYRVRAVGNDNWEISEPNMADLDGVYIDHEPLCEVNVSRGANILQVTAELIVKQKDLLISLEPITSWSILPRPNRARLIGILTAKALNSTNGKREYDGTVTFARSVTSDEG